MTNKQFEDDYLFNKKIPRSIIWKDDSVYFFHCANNCRNLSEETFPNWFDNPFYLDSFLWYYNQSSITIFNTYKKTMKECLIEFLYWFEINKNNIKKVTYYDKRAIGRARK